MSGLELSVISYRLSVVRTSVAAVLLVLSSVAVFGQTNSAPANSSQYRSQFQMPARQTQSPPQQNQPPAQPPLAPQQTANANLFTSIEALDNQQKLGVGDRLSFRVIEDKDEPKALVVTDSGEMDIPYLGRVKGADKTCQSLAREIKAALEKELYYKATVILAIDQLNKKRGSVYMVGQVRATGAVEIPSDEVFTVSKAILRAGGFGDFADKKHVKITRKNGGEKNRVILVDLTEILERGQTDKDVKLETGDLVFVPSKLFNF